MKKLFPFISMLIVLAMALAACSPAAAPTPTAQPMQEVMPEPTATPMPQPTPEPTATEAPKTIVDIAVADGRFTTLVAALQAADLVGALSGEGPFTVFAPTNEAFAKLPAGTVEGLLKDIPALTNILLYHVVSGKVMAADVVNLKSATTLQGKDIQIKVEGNKVMINDAQVIITDIEAANGVIHVIDSVILPPTKTIVDAAVEDGRFTTLVAALEAAELVDALKGEGPFTVFAPTDEAFAKLPAGTVEGLLKDIPALTNILLYHVVPGKLMAADVLSKGYLTTLQGESARISSDMGKAMINEAQIILTDIETDNGVIHVIDSVILPGKTVAELAAADGRFTTLVAALGAAELVDTLNSEGPFTVFAPTDEAFAKLPAGTVESLLKDIPALTNILLYHVAPGKLMADEVIGKNYISTVQGESIRIKADANKVMVNEAQIILTDIVGSNGVIHVIDSVILPGKTIADVAVADGRFTTLVTALQAANLVETLSGKGPFTVFAPTDEAFKKLPAGTIDALLKDIPQLKNILLYHVVAGKVMAEDVVKLTEATTVQGQKVTVKVDGGKVFINDAQVIITDIVTANGVIHVIDTVLLPK